MIIVFIAHGSGLYLHVHVYQKGAPNAGNAAATTIFYYRYGIGLEGAAVYIGDLYVVIAKGYRSITRGISAHRVAILIPLIGVAGLRIDSDEAGIGAGVAEYIGVRR